MKIKLLIIVFIISVSFFSCEKTSGPNSDSKSSIIGNWKDLSIIDSIYTFSRTENLIENEYGFIFKLNNQFIERKNSSWCGTPPVSYSDYNGIWDCKDSIINISVSFWGGLADYQWKIIYVDNQKLKIYKITLLSD